MPLQSASAVAPLSLSQIATSRPAALNQSEKWRRRRSGKERIDRHFSLAPTQCNQMLRHQQQQQFKVQRGKVGSSQLREFEFEFAFEFDRIVILLFQHLLRLRPFLSQFNYITLSTSVFLEQKKVSPKTLRGREAIISGESMA